MINSLVDKKRNHDAAIVIPELLKLINSIIIVAFEDALSEVFIVNCIVNVCVAPLSPEWALPPTAIEKFGVTEAFSVDVTEENALSTGVPDALPIDP